MELKYHEKVVFKNSSSNPRNFRNFSLSAALPRITPPLAHATVIEGGEAEPAHLGGVDVEYGLRKRAEFDADGGLPLFTQARWKSDVIGPNWLADPCLPRSLPQFY